MPAYGLAYGPAELQSIRKIFVVTSCRTDLTLFSPYGMTSQQIFLCMDRTLG